MFPGEKYGEKKDRNHVNRIAFEQHRFGAVLAMNRICGRSLWIAVGITALVLMAGRAGALSSEENAYLHLYEQMDRYKNGSSLRLIQSYVETPTHPNDYTAWVYDNDLALLALIKRGAPEDMSRAKILADALVWVQNHDQDFSDGRIRDGYWANSLSSGNNSSIKSPGSGTGNMAWTIIALVRYYEVTGNTTYLNAAERLGNWINDSYDIRSAGGYTGGYEGWDAIKIDGNPQNTTLTLMLHSQGFIRSRKMKHGENKLYMLRRYC